MADAETSCAAISSSFAAAIGYGIDIAAEKGAEKAATPPIAASTPAAMQSSALRTHCRRYEAEGRAISEVFAELGALVDGVTVVAYSLAHEVYEVYQAIIEQAYGIGTRKAKEISCINEVCRTRKVKA